MSGGTAMRSQIYGKWKAPDWHQDLADAETGEFDDLVQALFDA
jgi:hypothetical protein